MAASKQCALMLILELYNLFLKILYDFSSWERKDGLFVELSVKSQRLMKAPSRMIFSPQKCSNATI